MLIRWGIPGGVFYGAFFFFILIDCVVSLQFNGVLTTLIGRVHAGEYFHSYGLVAVVTFCAVTAIPIGFVISQVYYAGFVRGLPFRTCRTTKRILDDEELVQVDREAGTEKLIGQEQDSDYASQPLSTALRILQSGSFHIQFVLDRVFGLPLGFLIIKPLNHMRKRLTLVTQGKRRLAELPWKPLPRQRSGEVAREHYRWVALNWLCMQHANPAQLASMLRQDIVFDAFGTTFLAIIAAWIYFSVLEFVIPWDVSFSYDTRWRSIILCGAVVLFYFPVMWFNRKDAARRQVVQMRFLWEQHKRQHKTHIIDR